MKLHSFVRVDVTVALVIAAGCGSPKPYVAHVDAVAIVRQNSADAFKVEFDLARDAAAFRSFDERVLAAHDRNQLTAAWRVEPSLASHGADFLETHVFALAVQAHRWPRTAPAGELDAAFVKGTHEGVQDFLAGR